MVLQFFQVWTCRFEQHTDKYDLQTMQHVKKRSELRLRFGSFWKESHKYIFPAALYISWRLPILKVNGQRNNKPRPKSLSLRIWQFRISWGKDQVQQPFLHLAQPRSDKCSSSGPVPVPWGTATPQRATRWPWDERRVQWQEHPKQIPLLNHNSSRSYLAYPHCDSSLAAYIHVWIYIPAGCLPNPGCNRSEFWRLISSHEY